MDVLTSDNAYGAISQKVKDILHMYHIKSYTSEPHHQNQNYVECCIGHIKDVMNHVLTSTGGPKNLWLLCLMYAMYILKITPNSSIADISPHQHLNGQTPTISPALDFQFYEPVYYSDSNSSPAPTEKKGRWVGLAPNVRNILASHIVQMIPITLSVTQMSVHSH